MSIRASSSSDKEPARRSPGDFGWEVRDALAHLDDPSHLQAHPLAHLAASEPGARPGGAGRALVQSLVGAIESLRPGSTADPSSHAWRGHRILSLRYVEGLGVAKVCGQLAISRAEYYRDHDRALAAVTSLLRERWQGTADGPGQGRQAGHGEPPRLVALSATRAPRSGLPIPLTSFVGRERELAEVKRLLEISRLLTLSGVGGCGKTRLASRVAADLLERYANGVWAVDLAPLGDPALVPHAVASALGLREVASRTALTTLETHLRSRHLLLVLDNCEHLVDACARLSEELLQGCPGLTILATSRETLGVPGEVIWRVPPLAVPDADTLGTVGQHSASQLIEFEAVRLFVERATSVQPGFTVPDEHAAALARICWRLDGLPLAIELAAAWAKVLSVEQIAERLGDRFGLLSVGYRTESPRHQTLRGAVDWSYELLPESERVAWRRLAVFAGGLDLEGAEAVCAGNGVNEGEVLRLLGRLVDKSLVQVEVLDGTARYWLLETIREYGWERLVEYGEVDAVQRRHVHWCLGLAERAEPKLHESGQRLWLDRLTTEHDNLRAALAWCRERDAATGLAIAASLWPFWEVRCHFREGRRWLEDLLSRAPEGTPVRAKALLGVGWLASNQWDEPAGIGFLEACLRLCEELGDRPGAAWAKVRLAFLDRNNARGTFERLIEESLAVFREVGDDRGIGEALLHLGVYTRGTDQHRALALLHESLSHVRKSGDVSRTIWTLNRLGSLCHYSGQAERARSHLEESLSLAGSIGDTQGVGWNLGDLGDLALVEGRYEEASTLLEQSLAIIRDVGDEMYLPWLLLHLGSLRRIEGDFRTARAALEECLALPPKSGGFPVRGLALASLGTLASRQSRSDEAASWFSKSLAFWLEPDMRGSAYGPHCLRLSGTFEAERGHLADGVRRIATAQAIGAPGGALLYPPDRAALDAGLAAARDALGEEAFARAWAEGQAMSLEQAVEYVLRERSDA